MSKILHVDDIGAWRSTVRRVLEGAGHNVSSYNTLKDAKQAARTGDFDVFVVDGDMYDGFSWASELKQGGKRVVVLSADPPKGSCIVAIDKWDLNDGSTLVKLVS